MVRENCKATCIDTVGSYRCQCNSGYQLVQNKICKGQCCVILSYGFQRNLICFEYFRFLITLGSVEMKVGMLDYRGLFGSYKILPQDVLRKYFVAAK